MKIQFDLRSEGEALPEAFLDETELERMFESTRRSIGAGLRRKFRGVLCAEHEQAPSFLISGVYDKQIEELDIQYHVDTCCRYFLLRVMQILNQQG
ncbi:MAG: hypothetical protein OXI40_05570 [Chloroflexota bacterium]|nr:hypothetical protein [Chloroflexota bacterium]